MRRSLPVQSVRQASALLAVTALLSNVLGLARNLVFYRLIAPDQLDAYFASFRIADFIFNLLIFGAITSAVIPVVSELLSAKKEKEAWETTNQLLGWSTLVLGGLIVLLAVFMQPIARLVVGGFSPEHLAATVLLSRLMLLQALFFGWSFITGALLNGYRRFTTYALAPLTYNLALIAGGFLAARYGVVALTACVVIGAFLHFLIQYAEARQVGFRFRPTLRLDAPARTVFSLMLPRSLTQGMNQVVLIVYTGLASYLPTGSISVFNGMNDLQTTPTVVIANSLATAYFPSLSTLAAARQWEEISRLLEKAVRAALFLLVPAVVLAYVLSKPLVELYFGLGATSRELIPTGLPTLAWFLPGIVPAAVVALLARVFYAHKDTRTPMLIGLVTSLLGIAVAVLGILYWKPSVAYLAAAESCIAISQLVLYAIFLPRIGPLRLSGSLLARSFLSYATGSLAAGLATYAVLTLFSSWLEPSFFRSALETAVAGSVGLLTYFGYSTSRSREELQWVKKKTFSNSR